MNIKARFLLIGLALLMAVPIMAQSDNRVWEPLEGVPVRQGYHIEWFRSVASNDDGEFAMVWSDTRTGGRDVYMQIIDEDGNALWDEGGKLIAREVNRQEDPHVMATSDGHWIVTWIDYRYDVNIEDKGDVFIMKYDSNGDPVWPEGVAGVPICLAPNKQLIVQSFDDGAGGAVSIWVDGRGSSTDIYAQHTNADGEIQWTEDGLMIAGDSGSNQGSVLSGNYTADTDGAGGIIFGWVDDREPTNINLYANRVDANGDLQWGGLLGTPICTMNGPQGGIRMAPDGQGGAFWLWSDSRNPDNQEIYGQHTNASGDLSWAADGAPIVEAPSGQEQIRIVNTDVGEAIAVWEDRRMNTVNFDQYVQRIGIGSGSPELFWGTGTEGIVLSDATGDQRQARLYQDGTGGAVVSWVDERFGDSPNNDLYAQRVDVNGNRVWGDPNGIVVSDAPNSQDGNIVRLLSANRVMVGWADRRLGSPGIYHQIFDLAGSALEEDNGVEVVYGIDGNADFPTVLPAGGDEYWLTWTDGRQEPLGTYPYVQRITSTVSTAEFQFEPNGRPLLPGFPYDADDTTSVIVTDAAFTPDGQGNLIGVWNDSRDPFATVLYAQKMDADGEVLWGTRGTPVTYDDTQILVEQAKPHLVSDGNGGTYIVYTEIEQFGFLYYTMIRAQHLDASGTPLWDEGGVPGVQISNDVDIDHDIMTVDTFEDGSLLIVYQRNEANDSGDKDLFARKLNLDGTLGWNGDEIEICGAPQLQKDAVTTAVDGGMVIAWSDQRRLSPTFDIYAQLIDPADGSLSWEADGAVMVEQPNQQDDISLASTGHDAAEFWMTWKTSQDGEDADIMTMLYDLNADPILTPAVGSMLGNDADRGESLQTLITAEGDAYVVWEETGQRGDDDDPAFSDLMYSKVMADGDTVGTNMFYSKTGEFFTNAYHDQSEISMTSDGMDGAIVIWRDNRSTGKETLKNVYMQRLNAFEDSVDEPTAAIPLEMELGNAYPNPFNPSTTIQFSIDRPAFVTLSVYDILGRRVTKIVNEVKNAGQHTVTWNGVTSAGQTVASGTYFYRLEADGQLITRNMVLIK